MSVSKVKRECRAAQQQTRDTFIGTHGDNIDKLYANRNKAE